ncbi:protein of unknown function DUF3535 [Trinorchestia longiramus]|nr:protein of unknown function DUF3535 [Trinorchestia longiramus]
MNSRLDRLFILLESSSSPVTRKAAASQLGDVVKGCTSESKELQALLERLLQLLSSKTWDTRVAAATALGCMLSNVPPWQPQLILPCTGMEDVSEWAVDSTAGTTTVYTMLQHGHKLAAHDEAVFDEVLAATATTTSTSDGNIGARLEKERALLNQKLGLDVAASLGLDTDLIITNDDLIVDPTLPANMDNKKQSPTELLSTLPDLIPIRANVKRTAPQSQEPCKRQRLHSPSSVGSEEQDTEEKTEEVWPLSWLSSRLLLEVFSGTWETRHGAATALRELLAKHGPAGGRKGNLSRVQMEAAHQRWVWDVCQRLVCVLALDAFGDYLGDQVVAPVRESVAQALGVACTLLQPEHVLCVVQLLQVLLSWQPSWTVRHGGLLGLKYLLAARRDIRSSLLRQAYTDIYAGLKDSTDEVVGVAAECLTVCCAASTPTSPAPCNATTEGSPAPIKQEAEDVCDETNSIRHVGKMKVPDMRLKSESQSISPSTETSVADIKSPSVGVCDAGTSLVEWLTKCQLQKLLATVWQSLLHVDDLSAFTPALLLLLASLMQHRAAIDGLQGDELRELVPRLFPLLYHASSGVRQSVLTTLLALSNLQPGHQTQISSPSSPSDGLQSLPEKMSKNSDSSCASEQLTCFSSACSSNTLSVSRLNTESSPTITTSSVSSQSVSVQKNYLSTVVDPQAHVTEVLPDSNAEVPSDELQDTKMLLLFQRWCESILTPLLRHLFQRSLLETNSHNLELLEQVWRRVLENCSLNAVLVSACPLVFSWLSLVATPPFVPLDASLLLLCSPQVGESSKCARGSSESCSTPLLPCYVGGSQHCKKTVVVCKTYAARLLGELSVYVSQPMGGVTYGCIEEPLECYTRLLLSQLNSRSANLRTAAASVTREWAFAHRLHHRLESLLSSAAVEQDAQSAEESRIKIPEDSKPVRRGAAAVSSFCASHEYLAFSKPQERMDKQQLVSSTNGGVSRTQVTAALTLPDASTSTNTVPSPATDTVSLSVTDIVSSPTTNTVSSLATDVVTVPSTATVSTPSTSVSSVSTIFSTVVSASTSVTTAPLASCHTDTSEVKQNVVKNDKNASINCGPASIVNADPNSGATAAAGERSREVCSTTAIQELYSALLNCLTQPMYYDEIAVAFTRLQQECRDFLALLRHYGVVVPDHLFNAQVFTMDQMCEAVQGPSILAEMQSSKLRSKVRETLEQRRCAIQAILSSTSSTQETLVLSIRGKAAGALVRMGLLPPKLNPVVKPLMDVIKAQDNQLLQSDAGQDLSLLLEFCRLREKSPNAKVLKNLAAFYCVDVSFTPNIAHIAEVRPREDKFDGVFFITAQNEDAPERSATSVLSVTKPCESSVSAPPVKRKRGRPALNSRPDVVTASASAASEAAAVAAAELSRRLQAEQARMSVQRRGCGQALQHLVRHFSDRLPECLPVLWGLIYSPLITPDSVHKPMPNDTRLTDASQFSASSDAKKKKSSSTPVMSSPLANCPFSVANLLSRSPPHGEKSVPFTAEVLKNGHSPVGCEAPSRLERNCPSPNGDVKAQDIINWLQLLEVVVPVLHPSLLDKVCEYLGSLELLLYHRYCAVRHMAARTLATLVRARPAPVMVYLLQRLLPALSDVHSVVRRQGAVECLHMVVEKLAFDVLPYIVLLLVPLLGSSSDSDKSVRAAGSEVFGSLIRLLPLDGCVPDPPDMPEALCRRREEHRAFLHQLMDGKKAHHYPLPVKINAELRVYQQAGVNWLAFLRDFGVHGILCDDMGLGKTLQTICILAATHHEHRAKQQAAGEDGAMLQSLVVCPPTLSGHWVYEVNKFVSDDLLRPLNYTGVPADRIRLREKFSSHNLVVASYDIVRNDVDFFADFQWLYVVLDEGHVIKNTKTKAYQAIRRLTGRHRLILSGTPIQNNVLELWSLFDFLMPGFLGSERQFTRKYYRPILASRDPKASASDQEAGVVAMEALHRQALPFMMRRLKEDVLKELPPKIMQDYYCELSPLQRMLYQDFINEQGADFQDDQLPKTHVFQTIQYLRLVCNHPALVLRPQHPRFSALLQRAGVFQSQLHNISFAAKLPALRELLQECGISGPVSGAAAGDVSCLVAPHRALIFCQLRNMLDIIENDLFKAHMPDVAYVRLDGSVPANERYGLVRRFNEDPSIDVMLLTTQVGGLGLNLTAADTVIFVEHDWNPMKDLQAMDRAHRIGQKRVVTVYRLITRNTLEEKIMGLQKFKLMTASTIISHDNASISSMGTEQILNLFSLEKSKKPSKNECTGDELLGVGAPKAVLESLPELWEQSQYHDEYDLDKFLAVVEHDNEGLEVPTSVYLLLLFCNITSVWGDGKTVWRGGRFGSGNASAATTPLKAQSVKRRLVLEEGPSGIGGSIDADGFRTPVKTPRRTMMSRVTSPHCSSPSPPTPVILSSHHRAKNNASPGKPSRYDTSLGKLTKEFLALLHSSKDGTVDLKKASELLRVQKRRIYDITNVLEGIGLVSKKFKNNVQLMSASSNTKDIEADVKRLKDEEEELDNLIHQMRSSLTSEFERERQFAYMDHCDVKLLYHDSTVFMVSPPAGSTLSVSANVKKLPLSLQLCTYGRPTVVHMYEGKPSWLAGMNCYKHNFATLTTLSQLMTEGGDGEQASASCPSGSQDSRYTDGSSESNASALAESGRMDLVHAPSSQSYSIPPLPSSSPLLSSSSSSSSNINIPSCDLLLRSSLPSLLGSSQELPETADTILDLPESSPSSVTPKKRSLDHDDAFTPPSKKPCRRRVTPRKEQWSPSRGGCVKVELAEDEGVGADDLLTDDVFATMFGSGDSHPLDLLLPDPSGFLNSDDPGMDEARGLVEVVALYLLVVCVTSVAPVDSAWLSQH